MAEVKVYYQFVGDSRSFFETHVLQPSVNADRLFETLNHEYNDARPGHEPERKLLRIEVSDPFKHQHSFSRVPGFEYYRCQLCGCKASYRINVWERLQGWEHERFEYCREKALNLPELKVYHFNVRDDIDVKELSEQDKGELKPLPRLKL